MMSVKAFKDKHIAGVPVINSGQSHFIGEICYSTVCPGDGWVECDGDNGTVDMRETRLFGTPNDASLGQRINDRFAYHRHIIDQSGMLTRVEQGRQKSGYLGKIFDSGYVTHTYTISSAIIYSREYPSTQEQFTRSPTYYVKMWMYVGD